VATTAVIRLSFERRLEGCYYSAYCYVLPAACFRLGDFDLQRLKGSADVAMFR
jgi:hypothetical protein